MMSAAGWPGEAAHENEPRLAVPLVVTVEMMTAKHQTDN